MSIRDARRMPLMNSGDVEKFGRGEFLDYIKN
jgi:hypothetical protein